MVTDPESPWYSAATKVILITPPPVNTYQRGVDLDPPLRLERLFETTKAYAEAVGEVGTKEGVPVVDVWNALYDAAGRDEKALSQFLSDGLHLNAAGYDVSRVSSFVFREIMSIGRSRIRR